MDRQFAHYGAIPLDTDFLKAGRHAMIGLGKLAEAVLGPGTWVHGLDCTPTPTPGLSVLVGQGEIYALGNVDDTDMGRLAADTTNQIVKQGLAMGDTTLTAFSAPGSSGQARNYLVQARYVDADTNAVVLPYYNAADPSSPWSGPNNSGNASATARQGVCVVSLKAGTAATLSALQAAHPTGAAGDYAQVDSGTGGTPHIYSWDVSDGAWALTSADGTGAANTDQLPEGTGNLYFTAARAVAACTGVFQAASTILSAIAGFTASTGFLKFASGTPSVGPISASDVSGLGSAATHAADDFATAAQAAALAGYDLPFCFEGSPGAGARLAAILLVRPVWMPFDLDGSIFRVDGAAGDYALAVQHLRDGEVLVAGTATLHPGGTATLLLDGDVDGWPGDELWISAPATPDAGVTSVRGTIKAEAVLP